MFYFSILIFQKAWVGQMKGGLKDMDPETSEDEEIEEDEEEEEVVVKKNGKKR